MGPVDTILEFNEVTLGAPGRGGSELRSVTFRLGPGDALIIGLADEAVCPPLADAAQGLLDPTDGCVLFMGEEWGKMSPDAVASSRSRIGRVYDAQAWISNLDLDENITLARRHHTRQPVQEIMEAARALAGRFGMEELPAVRPVWAEPRQLRLGQWVRALLGEPVLLVLERPTREASDKECAAWIGAVEDERARGAAVLWLTSDRRVLRNRSIRPAIHATLKGEQLVWAAETSA